MHTYHQKLSLLVLAALLITLLAFPFLLPATHANPIYQTADQPLQGMVVRFGTANRESSPFDRSVYGASRLASYLSRAGASVDVLNWEVPVPADTSLIVLVGPTQDYSGFQVARLWTYLEDGGKLLILSDPPPIAGDSLRSGSGIFELLWTDFGIRAVDYALVNPADNAPPPAPAALQDAEGTPYPTPTALPAEVPPQEFSGLTPNQPDHPIFNGVTVENLVVNLARPLETSRTGSATPLLYTNSHIYGEADAMSLAAFGVYHFDSQLDKRQQIFLLAAAAEHPDTEARVVVIGDADWGRNGYGFSSSPPGSPDLVFPDTVRFVVNSAFWLLGAESPVIESELPAPTVTPTPTMTPTAAPAEGE